MSQKNDRNQHSLIKVDKLPVDEHQNLTKPVNETLIRIFIAKPPHIHCKLLKLIAYSLPFVACSYLWPHPLQ